MVLPVIPFMPFRHERLVRSLGAHWSSAPDDAPGPPDPACGVPSDGPRGLEAHAEHSV